MPDRDVRLDRPREEPLPERELSVLRELAREAEAKVAFQGLRRRLSLHQEILTRTLRRLEREGLVAKEERGYRLTETGYARLRGTPRPPGGAPPLPLVQALLPPDVEAEDVVHHLGGRWFAGLHWYGESTAPGETTLTWIADPDGGLLRVRIAGGALTLEAATAGAPSRRVYAAARSVLAAVAELYGLVKEPAEPVQALVAAERASAA